MLFLLIVQNLRLFVLSWWEITTGRGGQYGQNPLSWYMYFYITVTVYHEKGLTITVYMCQSCTLTLVERSSSLELCIATSIQVQVTRSRFDLIPDLILLNSKENKKKIKLSHRKQPMGSCELRFWRLRGAIQCTMKSHWDRQTAVD